MIVLSPEELNVAANVRRLMEEQDLSLRQLESLSGVPYKTIHILLIEKSSPRVATLVALAGALDVSVEQLLAAPSKSKRRKVAS